MNDDCWYGPLLGFAVGYLWGWWQCQRVEKRLAFWRHNYAQLWAQTHTPLTPENGRGRTAEK